MIDSIKEKIATIIPYHIKIYTKNYIGKLVALKQESYNNSLSLEHNININRDKIQKLYVNEKYNYEHVLLLDSDVMLSEQNINDLLNEYDGKTPLCIDTKNRIQECKKARPNLSDEDIIKKISDHVVCACCLMPAEDWLKIDYLKNPNECQCLKIKNAKYSANISCSEYREIPKMSTNEKTKGYPPEIEVYKTMPDGSIEKFIS